MSECFEALFKRTTQGIKPGLEVISVLLEELGNPHQQIACVHVAGTNGKGSVCSMIESVLRASGFKTGLYTSPHLVHFSERFRINGEEISEEQLKKYVHRVDSAASALEKSGVCRSATFFEISTAIAFLYFAEQKVDFAVIETGMGGRWDATNTIIPLVSVITRIDMDHADYLGDSIEMIAGEKAGIIKQSRPVVCAPQLNEVADVLQSEATEKQSSMIISSEAISVRKTKQADVNSQRLSIETSSQNLPPINLPLLGEYQRENCAVAVVALELIADIVGFEPNFKLGLESVSLTGRFQVVNDDPPIIIDGAHNPSAAVALVKTLKENYPGWQVGFVLGFLGDKDASDFLRAIQPVCSQAWCVGIETSRGLDARSSADMARLAGISSEPSTPSAALESAKVWAGEGKRLICVTGSLYLQSKFLDLF